MDLSDKVYVEQETVDEMIASLCDKIEAAELPINKIVGIANGGLNVSIPLAKMLRIPHQQLRISFYEGDFIFEEQSFVHEDDDVILLVDDLIDSGKTIGFFNDKYHTCQGQNLYVASLFFKFDNDHFQYANFYAEDKPEGWCIFPWENLSSTPKKRSMKSLRTF